MRPAGASRGPTYAAPERPMPPSHGSRPVTPTRPYTPGAAAGPQRPIYRSGDVRYSRPSAGYVRNYPGAQRPVPTNAYYRPYYTRWWVHPWYRWNYATSVYVGFGFPCSYWDTAWIPPYRAGWAWSPGVWTGGIWWPGYWRPMSVGPVGYAYVPGYWWGGNYVEGWYRPQARANWAWNDGYYLADGAYVRGYWEPTRQGPAGYTWEPGFWDGESWVEGFWRPEFRSGYTWVSSYYDADGIFHAGYWAPTQQNPGYVWIPGWFDGNQWVEGYWVEERQYETTDVGNWQPEAGYNDGWDVQGYGSGSVVAPQGGEQPLGIPVEP